LGSARHHIENNLRPPILRISSSNYDLGAVTRAADSDEGIFPRPIGQLLVGMSGSREQ
jgi:hypothetical protein